MIISPQDRQFYSTRGGSFYSGDMVDIYDLVPGNGLQGYDMLFFQLAKQLLEKDRTEEQDSVIGKMDLITPATNKMNIADLVNRYAFADITLYNGRKDDAFRLRTVFGRKHLKDPADQAIIQVGFRYEIENIPMAQAGFLIMGKMADHDDRNTAGDLFYNA